MKTMLRITLFAGIGWLAGEITARTLLRHTGEAAAAVEPPVLPAKRTREVALSANGPRGITAAELQAAPGILATAEGMLELEERLLDTDAAEFPALLDEIARSARGPSLRQTIVTFFAAWAEKDVQAALAAIKRHPGFAMSALYGVLLTWPERDPQSVMKWLTDETVSGRVRMQSQDMALMQLVKIAPEETLLFARNLRQHGHPVAAAITKWRALDAAAADRWFAAAAPDVRRDLFAPWITALSAGDPAAAWHEALLLAPDDAARAQALEGIFNQWRNERDRDGGAAKALAALPADAWHESLAHSAGRRYSSQPETAERLSAVMPPALHARFRASALLCNIENASDMDSAARNFTYLPTDCDDRLDCASRIVAAWAERGNFDAAAAWIETLPRDLARDFATAELAEKAHATDPEAARAWAGQIQSGKMRVDVLRKLAQ